jgi:hypothetical protein
MGYEHTTAAIANNSDFVESICYFDTCILLLVELFPLVGYESSATKTTYWNNHSNHL